MKKIPEILAIVYAAVAFATVPIGIAVHHFFFATDMTKARYVMEHWWLFLLEFVLLIPFMVAVSVTEAKRKEEMEEAKKWWDDQSRGAR